MARPPQPDHAPVVFTDDAFDEDIAHAGSGDRAVAEAARRRYERDGAPIGELRKVEAEGRDGTILPGCLNVYLPAPDGRFGMVFKLEISRNRMAAIPRVRCPPPPQGITRADGLRNRPPATERLRRKRA
jgi:hypothetical protein